jgi:zinc protease
MHLLHRSAALVLTAFLALPGGHAQPLPAASAQQPLPAGLAGVRSVEGIDEYRLANGLQVLLVADDSKPTTTVNLTYRVGSRHENYGETGMAHLLEHMLFKGSPTNPDPKAQLTRRGLSFNGTTSLDRTNYFASFAANDENLRWYLGWEADAMVNSFVARKDLDTEMTVVRNEMESGENSPGRILLQRTMGLMYDWHNYGHSTIGARADVENVDIPRLQAFYRTYYQPDNATLIVAGKFDTARTLEWIAESFGKIPKPTRTLPTLYTIDPVQDGERAVTLRRVGGSPLLYAGYHVPAGAAADSGASSLLSVVLGDTPSGRLHKRLVTTRLAAAATAFDEELADPGALFANVQLAPGQDVEKAKGVLLATLESFAGEPVTEDEVSRAKIKWLNDWDQAFTNPETIGIALSESIALGDWRLYFLARDRVRATTAADVQRFAVQYLTASNRTLGTYLPTEKPVRAPAPARADVATALKDFRPQVAAAKVEAFEATPANLDARTQTFTVGGMKAALLPKGTRGGAVQAVLTLHYGDESSLFGQRDAADITAALLDKGTRTLNREQFQDRLDALRTTLAVASGAGRLTVTLASKRDTLPAAIALVGEMLRSPALPAEALQEYRQRVLTTLEQQRKDPRGVAQNAVARAGNPYRRGDLRYARSFDEIAEDLAKVTIDDVRGFQQRFYGAARAEFAAVGDMDPAAVRAALKTGFEGWVSATPFARIAQPLVPVQGQRLLLETPDKQNATLYVRLGVPLVDTDPDYPALMVANHLLGTGSSSRLWQRIREKEGISYGVGSNIDWNSIDRNSPWAASAIFAPQNRERIETAFREEVARAASEGFTAQELAEGTASLLNFRRLSRAQDASVAQALANNLYLDRTFAVSARIDAAIQALTLEQVNAAMRKYLTPDNFVAAYAGDFKLP